MLYQQIELPLFLIVIFANLALTFIVWRYAPPSIARTIFIFFLFAQIFWVNINYLTFLATDKFLFLLLARLTMFFATIHAFFFFLFIYTFLETKEVLTKRFFIPSIAFLGIIAVLTLTPYIFSYIEIGSSGEFVPRAGYAMPLFGIFVFLCVIGAFYSLIKKTMRATGVERRQWKFLAIGLSLTFFLVITFSFLSFIIFNSVQTVRFGHLYTLPFVIFTVYAMIRHSLFNSRIIVAEFSVFLLNLILFIQLVTSSNAVHFGISLLVSLGTLTVSILFIRSFLREVEQREELQKLASELAGANDELKKLDQAKSEFISIASHQLRAPLTVIKGYTSLILEGSMGKITKAVSGALQKTATSTEQLIKLVADLLDLSRIESGKMQYEFMPMDFPKLVEVVVDEFKHLAEKKGVVINFKNNAAGLPPLTFDSDKIREVVINLVDNAVKYTKEKSSIEIIISEPRKGWVRLAVHDQGIGIRSTDIKKLFIKFNRTDEARVIDQNGMGIGLYFVKRIVEDHGGKVWGESEGLNKGSTFSIELPIK